MTKRFIYVTFEEEGIHYYPTAGDDPDLADVSFLGHQHRHIFKFKVHIEVFHNDRDLEFIQVKRWLQGVVRDKGNFMANKSCEMLADDLYAVINDRHPGREVRIEVSEDGENGCLVEYDV